MRVQMGFRLSAKTFDISLKAFGTLLLALQFLPLGAMAAYTGYWYTWDPWMVVQTQDKPYYNVGDDVNTTFHVFYNGQSQSLDNLRFWINNGTDDIEEAQLQDLGNGRYKVNFTLEEEHLSSDGQVFLDIDSPDYLNPFIIRWAFDTFPPAEAENPPESFNLTLETWPRNQLFRPGTDLEIWANVTSHGEPYDPEIVNISFISGYANTEDYYPIVNRLREGTYSASIQIPPDLKEPVEWDLIGTATNDQTSLIFKAKVNHLIQVGFFQAWSRWIKFEKAGAEIEIGVADISGEPLNNARVTLKYEAMYGTDESMARYSISRYSNSSGLVRIKFPEPYGIRRSSPEIWVNHSRSQKFNLPELPQYIPRETLGFRLVGGYGNVSGEPWRMILEPNVNGDRLPTGHNITVVAFTTYDFIEQVELTTDELGQIEFDFIPPRCDCQPLNFTHLRVYLVYWNGSEHLRTISMNFPIHDYLPRWGPSLWDTLSVELEDGHLWLGQPSKFNLTLPNNLPPQDHVSISNFIWLEIQPSDDIGWVQLGFNWLYLEPYSGPRYQSIYLPRFLPEGNYTLNIGCWPEAGFFSSTYGISTEATFPAIKTPPPPPPPPGPLDTSSFAAFILLGVTVFAGAAFIGGWYRQRSLEEDLKAQREAIKQAKEEKRAAIHQAALKDHSRWKPQK